MRGLINNGIGAGDGNQEQVVNIIGIVAIQRQIFTIMREGAADISLWLDSLEKQTITITVGHMMPD